MPGKLFCPAFFIWEVINESLQSNQKYNVSELQTPLSKINTFSAFIRKMKKLILI